MANTDHKAGGDGKSTGRNLDLLRAVLSCFIDAAEQTSPTDSAHFSVPMTKIV